MTPEQRFEAVARLVSYIHQLTPTKTLTAEQAGMVDSRLRPLLDALDAAEVTLVGYQRAVDAAVADWRDSQADLREARAALRELSSLIAARNINKKHAAAIAKARKP